jgi:tRNA-dihydrouridine synthase
LTSTSDARTKIAARGAGAGMLQKYSAHDSHDICYSQAVKIPVTVKTRLGWDENSKIIPEVAERLQDTVLQA